MLVESVSGTDKHYNSTGNARKTRRECSLYSMCPINVHYRGIYRWRSASQMQLLPYVFTTVIFLEYSWTYTQFSYYNRKWITTQMGPVASGSLLRVDPPRHAPQRRALFRRRASPHLRPTNRRPKCPSLALRFDACAIPSSRIFGCLAKEQRRLAFSSLVLGLSSSARAV